MQIFKFFKIILLLMLFINEVNAQDIVSLSHGTCWATSLDDSVKVADFQNGQSFTLDQYQVSDYLVGLIGFKKNPEWLNTTLHCGSFGHSLIFNIRVENKQYCIWSYKINEHFKLISMGVSEVNQGSCDGLLPGSVLLNIKENTSDVLLVERLSLLQKDEIIIDYKFITPKIVKVLLPRRDHYNENIVAEGLI
jgi:hypothetical protein